MVLTYCTQQEKLRLAAAVSSTATAAGESSSTQSKFSDLFLIFHDPHSGLSHNESILLMSKLLNTNLDAELAKHNAEHKEKYIDLTSEDFPLAHFVPIAP